MMISVGVLAWMVGIATVITALAPVVLLVLWLKDYLGGHLW